MSSFTNEKRQCVRVDRTLDKIVWPTKSNVAQTTPPAVASEASFASTSSKAALIELKPAVSTAERDNRGGEKGATSFDLSVLIGDAHSLIRFTMYTRVPPQPKVKKGKKEVEPSEEKPADKGSGEDVEVKAKLLPKVQNEPHPETLSVTMECSDSNV